MPSGTGGSVALVRSVKSTCLSLLDMSAMPTRRSQETTRSDIPPRPILLRRGRIPDAGVADVLVRAGKLAEIGTDLAAPPGADIVELGGKLILPGLVDAHCHLDKTLYGGPWVSHLAGDSLADRIRTERAKRLDLGLPNVDRITALLEAMVTAGTVYARSHIDIAPELGLTGVTAVREACARRGISGHLGAGADLRLHRKVWTGRPRRGQSCLRARRGVAGRARSARRAPRRNWGVDHYGRCLQLPCGACAAAARRRCERFMRP